MHRIDTPDRDIDEHGTGKDGWKDGGAPGSASTSGDADWFDAQQEELANVVEGVGITLNKSSHTQLFEAFKNLCNRTAFVSGQGLEVDTGITGGYVAVAYAPSLRMFVCAGNDGGNGSYARSEDLGLTWTTVDTGADSDPEDMVWAPALGMFIAVGEDLIRTSTDGITWTARTAGSSYTGTFNSVAWSESEGLAVAVGTGGEVQTSTDGITWTRTESALGSQDLLSISYSEDLDLWLTTNVHAFGNFWTSPDADTWTERTPADSYPSGFQSSLWSTRLQLFIGVGRDAGIQTSPDGITWTTRTADDPGADDRTLTHIAECSGLLIASEQNGYFQLSWDGITWNRVTLKPRFGNDTSTEAEGIVFGDGVFVLAGEGATIRTINGLH